MAEMKWTREFPRGKYGWYWQRSASIAPCLTQIDQSSDGCDKPLKSSEYLGPITPAHVFTQADLDAAVAAARGEVERLTASNKNLAGWLANSEDSVSKENDSLRQQLEQAQGRVAELEELLSDLQKPVQHYFPTSGLGSYELKNRLQAAIKKEGR
jgi:TolA-binding protein